MKADVPKPLLFDEIMTISLYGTAEEQDQLDEFLQFELDDHVELEIFAIAERIRERRNMGMRWKCCPLCQYHDSCILKWIKQEHHVPSICCFRCRNNGSCVEDYRRQKEAGIEHPKQPDVP